MIVTTVDLYQIAYGKYAIGAYNVNNLEQILGMFRGCIDSQAPFIILNQDKVRTGDLGGTASTKEFVQAIVAWAKRIEN